MRKDDANFYSPDGKTFLKYAGSSSSCTIEEGVINIDYGAFSRCTSLVNIIIPSSVKFIALGAFGGCENLESITIPFLGASIEGVWAISHFGFIFGASDSYSNSSYVPASLKTVIITGGNKIGQSAFLGCSNLLNVIIPNTVTNIDNWAFSGCSNLSDIIIPNTVENIGQSAFYGCSKLESIILPNSVENIGGYAFSKCSNLTSIIIPNSVINIGIKTFEDCSNLAIYCRVVSQPDGWSSNWNPNARPVYWEGQWTLVDGVPVPNES